jgi:hypothetical protein
MEASPQVIGMILLSKVLLKRSTETPAVKTGKKGEFYLLTNI